jgi:TetR/AcrR family transcriptional regulator, transcriptional repressor for nem operon
MTTATDHPTRVALLDAGTQLAARDGLHSVSINNIVHHANLAKGTFYVHFTDRTDYLVALHRGFHDRIWASVARVTEGQEAGRARLQRSVNAYLDGCLGEPLTRAILFDARSEPAIRNEIDLRNLAASKAISRDLKTMGMTSPAETARLVVAMTADIAVAEHEAGHKLPPLRTAMLRLVTPR